MSRYGGFKGRFDFRLFKQQLYNALKVSSKVIDTSDDYAYNYQSGVYDLDSTSSFKAIALYNFTTVTFTTPTQTGPVGPTRTAFLNQYTGDTRTWMDTYILDSGYDGIFGWTVPEDATYTIECHGAGCTTDGVQHAGSGVIIKADFVLAANDILWFSIGQQNTDPGGRDWTGGAGGTFVCEVPNWSTGNLLSASPVIIAGGAASETSAVSTDFPNCDGARGTSGVSGSNKAPGRFGGPAAGGGHFQDSTGGGAAGLYASGTAKNDLRLVPTSYGGSYPAAQAWILGATGGYFQRDGEPELHGGFGCGGPGGWQGCGGGGGYSGGSNNQSDGQWREAGGGGSFIRSDATNVATSDGTWTVFSGTSWDGRTFDPVTPYSGSATNLNAWEINEGRIIITKVV